MPESGRHALSLTLIPGEISIARLTPGAPIPEWANAGSHTCIARTPDELSIVVESRFIPSDTRAEHGWRLIRFPSPLPFGLTGIFASVCTPLADARIPIFAFSTFDTDYIMVNAAHLDSAATALRAAGHTLRDHP